MSCRCHDPRIAAVVLAERERCAKIAKDAMADARILGDKEFADGASFAAQHIATKIEGGE